MKEKSDLPIPQFAIGDEGFAPTRGSSGSAGWDLYAPRDFHVPSLGIIPHLSPDLEYPRRVPLAVSVAIPFGYVGLLSLRSSLGLRGLVIPNSPGIIDSDYRGELCLILANLSRNPIAVSRGDRVAQLTIIPYNAFGYEAVAELPPANTERTGGLGSTGR